MAITTSGAITTSEPGFDPDALRERYRIEREKRLREDGSDQYLEASGRFARYNEEDPYAPPGFTRDPVVETVEVVIIGGGFSGLLASARLLEAGIEDFRIVEAAADFGGTWYWNRYPGAQCDIESYCYLPLLEELDYMPKEKYSYGEEIYEHAQRIGKHYGLYDKAHLQTRVRSIAWDDASARWRVATNRDDEITARFVIMALGPASRPKLPGVPGIEDFEGHSFHTSRWEYAYTGGNSDGGMTNLADKRVAIIGTGATAIQCVPRVAEHAKHLYVFQRTPSAVDLRGNKPTDPEWWTTLQPGWQRRRRDNFGAIIAGHPVEEDLVQDGWTDMARSLLKVEGTDGPPTAADVARMMQAMEVADFRKMDQIRRRVDDEVADEQKAEALKPWYRFLCKRPTFNDEYLPCFNRDNVTLVDVSESKGVERITPKGVVANGTEYEVDCIIYASGFEITTQFKRRIGFDITGRHGVSLFDHWAENMRTFHGFTTRGFPNWFYVGISQNAISVNMTAMFDEQARHIAYIIRETNARGAATVEPTPEAQDEWVRTIESLRVMSTGFLEACTPGYYNDEGKGNGPRHGVYTPGLNAFNALLEQWRAEGSMAGLDLQGSHDEEHTHA